MKCPNCGIEMEKVTEREHYCEKDDLTIVVEAGKKKAQIGKGRLQTIEETLMQLTQNLKKVAEDIYGDDSESMLPFGL